MYIDRDSENNIVALYARPQRKGHEFLEGAELPKPVQVQIADLESEITPRRLRDAILTPAGADWLEVMEARIEKLRVQL